jgi:hypothetical protein
MRIVNTGNGTIVFGNAKYINAKTLTRYILEQIRDSDRASYQPNEIPEIVQNAISELERQKPPKA